MKMKWEFDTLKCAKMLLNRGLSSNESEAISETLSDLDIRNLYSSIEVDTMLSEAVKNTFVECRHEFDSKLALYEKMVERRIESDVAEARSSRRWMMGTIITCTLSLAGYLSACIHLLH